MKKTGMMYVIVLLVMAILAAGVYFLLSAPVSVTLDGKSYALTSAKEEFASASFVFEAEDGARVEGASCPDCGGIIVTHSELGANVTGKAVREGFGYREESVAEGCSHSLSDSFSHDDAYLFTNAFYSRLTMDKNATTVWIYLGIAALVSLCGVYFYGHQSKRRRPWLGTVMIGGGAVVALAVLFDLLMM